MWRQFNEKNRKYLLIYVHSHNEYDNWINKDVQVMSIAELRNFAIKSFQQDLRK